LTVGVICRNIDIHPQLFYQEFSPSITLSHVGNHDEKQEYWAEQIAPRGVYVYFPAIVDTYWNLECAFLQ